eukprot:TRINITY_DN1108_c0_g1_i1.p1 TRINITY_DN1108_c0_g1~~TRINITY_DN1108_c0_g1_i1.p1  ORF type:complete len:145 (+),score=22.67 TRINITY_DN1108_c0_g1_i1:66-437(+)
MLLKVVGKGSFGKVLQVRNRHDGKIYAMKQLKKEHIIKRNQVEHTKTERFVLQHLKHHFIMSLQAAFQTDKKLYLILDYCPGGELFFHLGKPGDSLRGGPSSMLLKLYWRSSICTTGILFTEI